MWVAIRNININWSVIIFHNIKYSIVVMDVNVFHSLQLHHFQHQFSCHYKHQLSHHLRRQVSLLVVVLMQGLLQEE